MTINSVYNNLDQQNETMTKDFEALIDGINSQLTEDILEQNICCEKKHMDEESSNETLHVSENSVHHVNTKETDVLFDSFESIDDIEEAVLAPPSNFEFFPRPSIIEQINSLKFPTTFSCEIGTCTMSFMTDLNLKRHVVLEHFHCDLEDDLYSINLVCGKCVYQKMCMFLFTDIRDYISHYHVHESEEFNAFIDRIFIDLNKEVNYSEFMMLSNNDILSEKYSFVVKKNEMYEMIHMLNRLRIKQGLEMLNIQA